MKLLTNTIKFIKWRGFGLFIPLLFFTSLSGQSLQRLSGTVIDFDSKQAIAGAELIIKNTDPLIVTTADEFGNFTFENLPEGIYYVQFFSEDYNRVVVSKVEIFPGRDKSVCFELSNQETARDKDGKFKAKLKELIASTK